MRELCAALEVMQFVVRSQNQHSPETHDLLMDVDGQMKSNSSMLKMVLLFLLIYYCLLTVICPGVWSSPELRGEKPPPCANFTFTMVDQYRAVFLGGTQPDREEVNDVYLFNFRDMVSW